jgi:site-specific recombinase XerD
MREHLQLSGYAPSTVISYVRAVRDLMEQTGRVPLELSEQEVISHLNTWRDERGLSPSALNTHIFGILYLYREVYKDKKVRIDIPNPGRSKTIGDILTITEVRELFRECHYPKQSAVLQLLYDTGLRAREVARLRLGDFDKANSVLYVRYGKGGKHRVVPYGKAVVEALRRYFEIERPTDWLFEGSEKGEPQSVLEYLGRYTHKSAISNHRLRQVSPQGVRFSYKDYRQGGAAQEMTLDGVEFLSRWCLHILPPGYRRMRHYGILSNAAKAQALAACRQALGMPPVVPSSRKELLALALAKLRQRYQWDKCPCCKEGRRIRIGLVPAQCRAPPPGELPQWLPLEH